MYRKILIPLDGSKLAEDVLPYAKYLAANLQLPLDLMHVRDPETTAMSIDTMGEANYLQQIAATLPTSLSVNCSVKTGRAPEAIVDTASKDAATLIAMATHGRSGAQRWLLGSVTQKVLRGSINPLLVIRPKDEGQPAAEIRLSSIILPLDGSHLAEKIFPHVVYLAKCLKLEVVLIRAYTLPTTGYYMSTGVLPPVIGELGANVRQEATDYLRSKTEELQAEGITKVSFVAEEGKGPEAIIDLARKTPHSFVAMSTHGRSGMGRWVLGSVTDRVVCYCDAPVLVIRPASS